MLILLRSLKRRMVREVGGFLVDAGNRILGNRRRLMPPTRMISIGGGDFIAIGFKFFHYLVHHAGLLPTHDVLDIGCGYGRLARPLTKYLTSGSYSGIEVSRKAADWCGRHFTPEFPHFTFRHVGIYNEYYNPRGEIRPHEFRFPFDDSSFDFVIASSVYTHMRIDDIRNYIRETARVLKPGGVSFSTWYLLDGESRSLMGNHPDSPQFTHAVDGENRSFTSEPARPEEAMAYDEILVMEWFDENGLHSDGGIHYGKWCGREAFLDYQDILISKKGSPPSS